MVDGALLTLLGWSRRVARMIVELLTSPHQRQEAHGETVKICIKQVTHCCGVVGPPMPTDEVCMDLIRQLRTSSRLQHAWSAQLWQEEQGPHPAAVMLLSEIERRGESRLSDLAKHRMVGLPVISRQVAELAAAGLIDRRPEPKDGRASLVRVSEEGARQLAHWRRLQVDFLREALAGWNEQDLRTLIARLQTVNADLRAAVEAGAQ